MDDKTIPVADLTTGATVRLTYKLNQPRAVMALLRMAEDGMITVEAANKFQAWVAGTVGQWGETLFGRQVTLQITDRFDLERFLQVTAGVIENLEVLPAK